MLLALLFSLNLAACSETPEEDEDHIWAENLFANRNSYIGDNVADNDLLLVLAVAENIGDYTLELQTDEEPYSLIIHFRCENPQNRLMEKYACIILALIDNVGKVSWTFTEGNGGEMDIAAANALLAEEVKSYGRSIRTVENLLDELAL